MASTTAVYLFSSNIRPRYEQDVLNVLAAPPGLTYRFRYRREWVADGLAAAWSKLAGSRCIIHFSLQQPHQYQDAVFFPLRVGTVLRTYQEARDIFLVEFSIEASVSLREPEPPSPVDAAAGLDSYRKVVADYRSHLVGLGVEVPYDRSASLGPDITLDANAPLDAKSDEGVLFERTSRLLAGSASFQRAKFFRVWRLEQRGAEGAGAMVRYDTAASSYRVKTGRSYQLLLLQSQPQELVGPAGFKVNSDDTAVKVVGAPRFEMTSRYDVTPLSISAIDLPTAHARDGVLEISPEDGVQGPALTLAFRTEPDVVKNGAAVALSIVGLILLGLPALADNKLGLIAVLLLLGGSVVATVVPFWVAGRAPWSG